MVNKIQSIYDYFSEFPKEKIDEIIKSLSEEDRDLLRKRYGDDLNNPNPQENLTQKEKDAFYGSLIPRIRRRLKNPNCEKYSRKRNNKKITSLYDALSDYPKEEIDKLVASLPDNQKEIVRIRFGSDLENPKEERNLTRNESLALNNTIIPKLKRNLARIMKNKENEQEVTPEIQQGKKQQEETTQTPGPQTIEPQEQTQPEIPNQNEESNINSLTTREGLKEMLEILTKPSFTILLEALTPKEAIIFSLRLGTGGKAFKANDIAEFLEIDVQDVYDTTNKALDAFQENVDMLLEKEEEKLQKLELNIKNASRENLAKRN